MIRSMTGYGKAEILTGETKYIVEIRSVNGKTADISLKTALVPKEKENEVKRRIAAVLQRGNIEVFVNRELRDEDEAVEINTTLLNRYTDAIARYQAQREQPVDETGLLPVLLRFCDVFEKNKKDLAPREWELLEKAIEQAVSNLDSFRLTEGESIGRDILYRVNLIEEYLHEVERLDPERAENVRKRLQNRLSELSADISVNQDRFEQELLYYLEKSDITEEKTRLRQHCKYFRETQEKEACCGRKLNFIAQEMGREINTIGSKASHALMQQYVVKMKDELEKIKEQLLNVL